MATAENEQKISIKIVVDKKKNKVIFAESDRYFVDILLSFLTMPLGTIARLVGTQQESQAIGSLSSLYRGVAGLDNRYLSTEACKNMLLYPRNSAEFLCKKLKLNIYDPEPANYFKGYSYCNHLSPIKGTHCSCGCELNREVCVKDFGMYLNVAINDVVFVNSHTLFIISDDLRITPASSKYVLELLKGVQDNEVNWTVLNIGLKEVLLVLRMLFLTNSVLTHAFLSDQSNVSSNPMQVFGTENISAAQVNNENGSSSICTDIKVKLVRKKNDLRVLYAEAGEDFVDLLFSFLAYPLGSVEKLCDGHLKHSNIDNLYKSVKDLDFHKFIGSDELKTMLLSPKVAAKFSGRNQLLLVDEASVPTYIHQSKNLRKGGVYEYYLASTVDTCLDFVSRECTIIDPKSTTRSTSSQEGYVKGPAIFMISDDLKVTPFSSYDAVKLIRESNVDVNRVEELVIKVGRDEALSILNASLVSASALSLVFSSKLQKLKSQESCRPKDFVFDIFNVM